ncbi:NAD(P)-dependent glycerol-3-phosphate dehydrogenase [Candidatus Competibacter phosphatis]|uniref:Glycerol-3-phosphate dehydrogenase [NAD(P)+] n=1 Tax=Candidatus Competibacter phosphatis TaxID=221280 RepID=A0ABX1TIR4_9GAMM|nr:NAD(P)H-dependent glycerol-3-phosphate dehydrogenase [Candidatus Competibacter phosphatis]NMQ17999.1 NAD(P)-dependent glycerol-3-phosphate dehydrogenase [Candidatus Competibacter phosphatis]
MLVAARVAVLGAGSWGTALALLLARNGHDVRLWGHDPEEVAPLCRERENRRYLPGVPFPVRLNAGADLIEALAGVELALVAVPSHAYGATLARLRPLLPATAGFAWATKGLEHGSGRFLHEVTLEALGRDRSAAVISGPSFAVEVARGLPTAVTVAAWDVEHARRVATVLHGSNLRAYTSSDVIGVELGGAVKNVLAIAAGIADGLGFGANARAALITRGLAEMVRLGVAVGGQRETFMGLAGIGDLVLTCTDDQSRNRRFGLAIGRGDSAEAASAAIGQVVEGAATVREIRRLARRHGVELPITEQVDAVLYHGQSPRRAVENLLARDPKPEGV